MFESTTILIAPESKEDQQEIERRVADRCNCRSRHKVRLRAQSPRLSGYGLIRDLSKAGIGLVVRQPFRPGTVLYIDLDSGEARSLDGWTAVVRHSTPLGDGSWLVGCALARNLSSYELFAML